MKFLLNSVYVHKDSTLLPGEYRVQALNDSINLIAKSGLVVKITPDVVRSSKMRVAELKLMLLETDEEQKTLLILRIPDATEWVFILKRV